MKEALTNSRSVETLLCLFVLVAVSNSQALVENFNYSAGSLATVSSGTWFVGSGNPDMSVVSGGSLSRGSYAPNNTDDFAVVMVNNNDQSDATGFSPITYSVDQTVYYSFLVNISTAPSGGNYFTSLGTDLSSDVTPFGAVYVRDNGTDLEFGIGRFVGTGSTIGWTISTYAKNTTHLLVVKYVFKGTNNDSVYLYVNPDISGPNEPTSADAKNWDNGYNTPPDLQSVVLYEWQTDGIEGKVDAIRVGTSWSDSPLPVQLTNFAAVASRSGVDLTWSTATEVNNYGFEIERRVVQGSRFQVQGNETWTVVGFVRGAGTSTARQEYSYSDFGLDPGRYAYRIKQIDFAGTYTYYSAAEVEVVGMPKELALEPNYPNPFNPSTNISFTVPQDGPAVLKVFNMLGQEVATLFNEEAVAGRLYKATFDASSLPTGVYVSRLEFGGQAVMRKMLFVK